MLMITKQRTDGLTLLEVITVLALISLLSVVVLSRQQSGSADLPARAQVLKAHLRYAQSRAMNTDTAWGIQSITAGSAYRLFSSDAPGVDRSLPGEDAGPVDLNAYGLAIDPGDLIVSFDAWGRPCGDIGAATPYGTNQTVTLRDGRGNTKTITITRNTGFVP